MPSARYSQHQIAVTCQMSQSLVSPILREGDLKPHKTDYWCGKSPDPNFESKMIDIVGLYLNPSEHLAGLPLRTNVMAP